MNTILHPKFVYDDNGNKIEAIIPIEEYYGILHSLMDQRDSDSIKDRLNEPETDFDIDELNAERELRKNGRNIQI